MQELQGQNCEFWTKLTERKLSFTEDSSKLSEVQSRCGGKKGVDNPVHSNGFAEPCHLYHTSQGRCLNVGHRKFLQALFPSFCTVDGIDSLDKLKNKKMRNQ